jgi:Leucine-rich repeat (LRR) protein
LDLHDNSLTGSIPEFIGDLQELVELDLSSNELSGSIPRTLADIQGLLVLVLNNNKLTGTIPDGLTKLPDLAVFAMWNNPGLTGTLPAFADQESLLIVGVYGSRFFDPAPIPPSIWRLPNLMHAYLGNCNFVGELPQDISPMIALQTLSLEKNQLSGSIPPSFLFDSTIQATTFPFLSILELNENELTGPIPLEMAELSNIQRLTLDNNELSGTVPSELARLPKLGTLELQGNNFDGDMNAAFCPMGLPLLEKLVADCYQGNGVIEPEVSCSCCSSCCVNGMACT